MDKGHTVWFPSRTTSRPSEAKRSLLLALVVCLGASTTVTAGDLDLHLVMRGALDDNPTIAADDQRQVAVKAQMRGAIDAFLPTVGFVHERIISSRIGYGPDIPVPTSGVDTTSRREPDLVAIQATLPLFDGFRRWNDLQAAMRRVEAGRLLSVEARQQVLLETITAYLAVIRDRGIVASRKRQISAVSTIAARTAASFDTQDATRSELATARSRVDAARVAHAQAEARLEASEVEFARIVGSKPGRLSTPSSPDVFLPRDVEALRRDVVDKNPRIAATQLGADAARYVAKAAVAELLPKVDLQFTHGIQTDMTPTYNRITDTTIKVVARIPIYTPGTLPRIEEARALSRKSQYEAIDSRKRSVASVEALFVERKGTQAALRLALKRLSTIREAVDARTIEQTAGYGTIMARLDAEAEAAEAAIAVYTLAYEADQLGWSIAAALAQIDDELPKTKIAVR